ncbi:MAG: succinate dehydrogenase, hydrophobic membrane anchor protein [Hyphomonadaceae bacterium]|nr:succinate dehydrogenase, hydrophobic membrane anchor protein [Hyphomonadaceae bacterium]
MKPSQASMRSSLGRVRGAGAARAGSHHFIATRVTSVALLVLAPWFAIAAALQVRSYSDAFEFLRQPLNAVAVTLLALVGLYHMMLGMQEVIVDYIAKPVMRAVLLMLNLFFCVLLAAAALWAVLQINFGW